MSQCVPNWDLDGKLHHHSPLPSSAATATDTSANYDVTELTWNSHAGHITTLPHSKPIPRYPEPSSAAAAAAAARGTLECIVDQVRSGPHHATSDAMVPCSHVCARNCTSEGSTTPTAAAAEKRKIKPALSLSTAGNEDVEGKSLRVDQNDCASRTLRSQRDGLGDRVIASTSAKRGREAAVHNQSERKRRDRINEKMKTLQKLLPNSTKSDKASMLEEVIDYLKLLQAQVQMMRRMSSIPTMMMMPIAMQHQQLQLAMMAQMTQMGMSLGMINPSLLSSAPPPPILHHPTFLPGLSATADSRDGRATEWVQQPGHRIFPDMVPAFMGCPTQQQAVSSEAYSQLAALYQQLYQQPLGSNQKT